MRILVTGGAGFIASHVVDLLISGGHDVIVVDNLSSGRKSNLNPQARFYQMDIRDPDLLKVFEAERPQIVDHHAAQVDVRYSVADPMFDADVNIRGSINLLEAARKTGVQRMIYISSGGAVYGEPQYLPCDEEHPIEALSPYGVSKHTVEHYLFLYRAVHGLDYSVLRYANVYGPRQNPDGEAGVVAIFCGRMLRRAPVTINGTGDQQRDFIYVSDCAHANLLAIQAEASGVFNIGTGIGTSINQVYRQLKQITNYPLEAAYTAAKLGEAFKIYLDASRAKQVLGWEPEVSLEAGLAETAAYFRVSE